MASLHKLPRCPPVDATGVDEEDSDAIKPNLIVQPREDIFAQISTKSTNTRGSHEPSHHARLDAMTCKQIIAFQTKTKMQTGKITVQDEAVLRIASQRPTSDQKLMVEFSDSNIFSTEAGIIEINHDYSAIRTLFISEDGIQIMKNVHYDDWPINDEDFVNLD